MIYLQLIQPKSQHKGKKFKPTPLSIVLQRGMEDRAADTHTRDSEIREVTQYRVPAVPVRLYAMICVVYCHSISLLSSNLLSRTGALFGLSNASRDATYSSEPEGDATRRKGGERRTISGIC
jgi:hypothetical protein